MKPETKFKMRIRCKLDAIENSYWTKVQQVTLRGTPDFLGCINGAFVALELKVGDNKADPLQSYYIGKIKQAGGVALILTPENEESVFKILEEL
jgi:hypothetical protein